ncbi:hypothetical protein BDZ97DRAFT_357453 [Flammula alnicola]|nr:hypothetical protein BDZ97DRAFT_357453 [Flammula alnicola]
MTRTEAWPRATPSIIPPELIRPIISYIGDDIPTIHALTLTCKLLQAEANLFLYHSFTHRDPIKHGIFLRAITTNPQLAALVQVYHSEDIIDQEDRELWVLTKRGVRNMTNLNELAFRSSYGVSGQPFLEGCTFSLKTLLWDSKTDQAGIPQFLENQPLLTRLAWTCRTHTIVSPLACPSLTVFEGNTRAIEAVIPGRTNVERIVWTPDHDREYHRYAPPMSHLSAEFSGLRSLSFGAYSSRYCLITIVDYLKSLEFLELLGVYPWDIHLIPTLPSLKVLVFSFDSWGRKVLPLPVESREIVVEACFSKCPRLERIDIIHEERDGGEDVYQRWNYNIFQKDTVAFSEVCKGRTAYSHRRESGVIEI